MIAPAALASIMALHLAAAVSPGPSFVMAIRVAATRGFVPACFTALGFGVGAALWAGAALFGLGLLFSLLPGLFLAMKLIGAGVLLFIAFSMWRHAPAPLPDAGAPDRMATGPFRLGLTTQMANPKPAMFFGAVFVGVVPPEAGPVDIGLILSLILVNETLWYVLVARFFSLPAARSGYARIKTRADRLMAGILAGLGLNIALR